MGAYIRDVEYYLPENVLTNAELQKEFEGREVNRMSEKIGVVTRHVVKDNETSLDLGENAAKKLLDRNKEVDVDFIIMCTQSPDYFLPTTACILQKRLGLSSNTGAIDINQGCSGFIYSLSIAKGLIDSGTSKNVLLVMAETYSKYINKEDLGNRIIFGDAASAILVSNSKNSCIGNFVLGTNGEGFENLIVPNGGARNRYNPNCHLESDKRNDKRTDNDLYMNGSEIFYFVGKEIPKVVSETLTINKLSNEDIDFYLFHQANEYMINFLAKKLKLNTNQYYNNIEDIGNTVSSTIPIALKRCIDNGLIKKGNKVLMCGFGVGYSWASVVVEI